MAKLTESDIARVRALRAEGLYQYEVAAILGVSKSRISDIECGKNWGHVP